MKTSTINLFRISVSSCCSFHASDKTTCSFNRFCFAFQQPDPVTASLFLLPLACSFVLSPFLWPISLHMEFQNAKNEFYSQEMN